MANEHDLVVLTEPLPAEGLIEGDVGTLVHTYADLGSLPLAALEEPDDINRFEADSD